MFKQKLKENKKIIIFSVILWLVLAIVLVMPVALGIHAATYQGKGFDVNNFIKAIQMKLTDPFGALNITIQKGGMGVFLISELVYTILFTVIMIIGIKKSNSNHEYYNIEHGSSDWSKGGEQYQILNRKEGIILAEGNYLPVDKRGNVNVLVVGRIRIW